MTDINPDSHLNLDSIAAVWAGAPLEQSVALHEAVGDQVLVLELDPGVCDEGHHRLVIHHDVAGPGTLDHLRGALVHNLGGEVLGPALGAEQVTTLQASHHLPGQRQAADVTVEDRGARGAARPLGLQGRGRLPTPVGGDDLGLLEHGLLVLGVIPLHKLLLVPLEVVQEDSDRGGGDLCDAGHLLDVLNHVTDNVLCTQDLKWARNKTF